MRRDTSYQMRLLKSTPNLASHPCPMHKNIVDLGHKLNCVKPQIFVPMDSSREDVQVSPQRAASGSSEQNKGRGPE